MQRMEPSSALLQRPPADALTQAPAAQHAAGAAEKNHDSPAAEHSCCPAPPGRDAGWRPWFFAGALLLPVALYSGWDWLVATGLATLLLALAPCLLMCALGLCMQRGKSNGSMSPTEIRKTYETHAGEPPRGG